MAATSYLSPTQRYAAGALFGLALHQAHRHQTHPLGLLSDDFLSDDQPSSSGISSSAPFSSISLSFNFEWTIDMLF